MISPSGPISLPIAELQTLIANCPSWQSWTGTATAGDPVGDAAKDVYLVDLPPPENASTYNAEELTALRPLARVDIFDPPNSFGMQTWVRTKVAEPNTFVEYGRLTVNFEDTVSDANKNDVAAAKLDFMNKVGAVLDEMAELSGTNAFLIVRGFEILMPFARVDQSQVPAQGDYYQVKILLSWGVAPRGE